MTSSPSVLEPVTERSSYSDLPRLLQLLTGDAKHGAAASSTIDILWVLYHQVLRLSPDCMRDPERDRFVLSKGHGPAAFYAVLAATGYIPERMLAEYASFDSPLGHHPDRLLVPGTEISSGSLGHGLSIAVGMALALRAQHRTTPRVICLLGDGEVAEGSVAEAIAFAGRAALETLTAIVVDNGSAEPGWPGGLASRFEVEGWAATTVDGRDHVALAAALADSRIGRPRAVVARIEAAR